MPLIIQEIIPRSLAAKSGLKAGDKLLSINGHNIRDFIDLQFYSACGVLECEAETSSGKRKRVEITRGDNTHLGIEPEPYKFATCRNHCVFCFIDQMPPALRSALYLKDDDYLYSFVFGNYISLTNLKESDYDRIIEQRLSPLYISVHTTNPSLRAKMMGYSSLFDIKEKLQKLSDADIQLHCQIVLVPDWNDKQEFKRSLEDLLNPRLNIASIGVVPVGLTRYRQNLPKLRTFSSPEAKEVLDLVDFYRKEHATDKIYCADEFFILAGKQIPDNDYYDDFPQLENGIGMVRVMLDNWKGKKRAFIKEVRKNGNPLCLVTGISAANYIKDIAEEITSKAECCPARVIPVINNYMGKTVTVSGLLTFNDIKKQVNPAPDEIVALPENIFNHDSITLDGYSPSDIKEYWQRDLLIIDPLFEDWEWI